jgi:hypothetical protein
LRTHPVVAAGLAHGTLDLFGWVSDLAHGTMRSFNPERGEFISLPGGPDDETFEVPPSISSVMTVVRSNGEGSRNG